MLSVVADGYSPAAPPPYRGEVAAGDRRDDVEVGHRRKITKREAIVTEMVNKSAKADLRATKMLFDMMKEVEQKARAAAPPEPDKLTPADEEVVEQFLARLRRQIAAEAAEAAAAAAAEAARLTMPAAIVAGDTAVDRVLGAAARRFPEFSPRAAFASSTRAPGSRRTGTSS